jgi:hypothetical protein
MKKAVFGIVKTENQAINIANQLQAAGFSPNDISVLFPDRSGTRDFAHEQHTKAPEGATAGAGTGAVLGGALGWMVGIVISDPGPRTVHRRRADYGGACRRGCRGGGWRAGRCSHWDGYSRTRGKAIRGKDQKWQYTAVRPRGGRETGHSGKGNSEERRGGGYFLYRRSFGSQQRSRLTKEATGGDGSSGFARTHHHSSPLCRAAFRSRNPARSGIPRHIVALHFKVRLAGGGGHLVESYLRLYSA